MSPATVSHAEDQRIVAIELAEHLEQLASVEVVDPRQLSQLWLEVRRCDAAALESLDPPLREAYFPIVQERRRPYPTADPSSPRALLVANARLRVAVHRRIMVLHLASVRPRVR